jgi:hypothetical protein
MKNKSKKHPGQTVRESRLTLVKELGPLSAQEMTRYLALKRDLTNHLDIISASFVKVGRIVRTIREEKLYRQEFTTFEDFCREVIGKSRRYINRVIQAHDLWQSMLEAGAQPDELPDNELQARVLGEYWPIDMQRKIAKKAREIGIQQGKTQLDVLSIRKAATQVMGSPEVKAKQADELVKKVEGIARAMKMAVDFGKFDEPQYQRFMAAVTQTKELADALIQLGNGATPELVEKRVKSALETVAKPTAVQTPEPTQAPGPTKKKPTPAKPKMVQLGSIAGIGPIMVMEMPPKKKTDTKEG